MDLKKKIKLPWYYCAIVLYHYIKVELVERLLIYKKLVKKKFIYSQERVLALVSRGSKVFNFVWKIRKLSVDGSIPTRALLLGDTSSHLREILMQILLKLSY